MAATATAAASAAASASSIQQITERYIHIRARVSRFEFDVPFNRITSVHQVVADSLLTYLANALSSLLRKQITAEDMNLVLDGVESELHVRCLMVDV